MNSPDKLTINNTLKLGEMTLCGERIIGFNAAPLSGVMEYDISDDGNLLSITYMTYVNGRRS
jgi:cytochrome c5